MPSLTRSPSSSSTTYCSSERSSLEYPSPPEFVDQQYTVSSIYGSDARCSLTPHMDFGSSLPSLDALDQPEWTGLSLLHPSASGAAMPSILSPNYGVYEATLPPLYDHDTYHANHPHLQPGASTTPVHTGDTSRSPGLASRSTVSYMPGSPVSGSLTPRMKMEHPGDYSQGLELSSYPSPRSVPGAYGSDGGSYTVSTSGYLSDGQSSWRSPDYQHLIDSGHYYGRGSGPSPLLQDTRPPYRSARPRRAPRRLTTRDEANFQCEVKGCGKLFSRSYNFKAHMETHEEKREYPFPCTADSCYKKFVRKTDLQRHHQSVHMKERNHECDYCGRRFARKDTLRRFVFPGQNFQVARC